MSALCVSQHSTVPTLSALQTKTDTCANSIDPDETARDEPSHQESTLFAILLLILE